MAMKRKASDIEEKDFSGVTSTIKLLLEAELERELEKGLYNAVPSPAVCGWAGADDLDTIKVMMSDRAADNQIKDGFIVMAHWKQDPSYEIELAFVARDEYTSPRDTATALIALTCASLSFMFLRPLRAASDSLRNKFSERKILITDETPNIPPNIMTSIKSSLVSGLQDLTEVVEKDVKLDKWYDTVKKYTNSRGQYRMDVDSEHWTGILVEKLRQEEANNAAKAVDDAEGVWRCEVCKNCGLEDFLLECEVCKKHFHSFCRPRGGSEEGGLLSVPEGDWVCFPCKATGGIKGDPKGSGPDGGPRTLVPTTSAQQRRRDSGGTAAAVSCRAGSSSVTR